MRPTGASRETSPGAAFRLRYRSIQRSLLNYFYRLTWDRQRSEDLAQEVFLAAYAKLRTFDPARSRF